MKSNVISAFPGAGKSTVIKILTDKGYTVSDSDSSEFNFKMSKCGNHYLDKDGVVTDDKDERVKNVNFINDYMSEINSRRETHDLIFVSSHSEVRKALNDSNIPFEMVGYDRDIKDEVVARIRNRDSNQPNDMIANILESNWNVFIDSMSDYSPVNVTALGSGEYLSDILI